MKRHIVCLLLIFALVVSGCGAQQNGAIEKNKDFPPEIGTSNESSSAYELEMQQREDKIISLLEDEIPYVDIVVSRKDSIYNLGITVKGSKYITDFGKFVLIAKSAFEAEFTGIERGELIVSLVNDQDNDVIAFSTDSIGNNAAGDYGLLRDVRKGPPKYTKLTGVEDLCSFFPATLEEVAKLSLDKNDVRIYDEVWKVLDEQYDRPEEEIFEELAPKYGMSADELKQFMLEMMEKIY